MSLSEQLKSVLTPPTDIYEKPYLKVDSETESNKGPLFELSYGNMYSAPVLNLGVLIKLSELFGTTEIDVDNYSSRGCDTCDYGSDYGHTIQIYNPTKNIEELRSLVGKGDLFE